MTTISITRALSELKLLDKRINKAINETQFVEKVVGKKGISGYPTVEAFEEKVKSSFQSINDLIQHRKDIKAKIVASNAVTKVEIAGKTLTVAEAIERKTSIEYEQELLNKMKRDFNRKNEEVERENINVQNRLDKMIQEALAGDTTGNASETIENISTTYKENNAAKIVNPLDILKTIEEKELEIDSFLGEVDIILSESNAKTTIEI